MKSTLTTIAIAAAAFCAVTAHATVRSSVFDDVKVWYKGAAGNAVGTSDSSGNQVGKIKNLPDLANASSSMHGGSYYWWGWRMSYENQPVYSPYANVTLDSTPCMVIASPVTTNSMETVTINGEATTQPNITYRCGDLHFSNWLADRDSALANYTLVLRFRNESINPVPGNQNRAIQVGSVWTSTAGYAAGIDLRLNPQEALGEYYSPRIVVGNNQQEFKNIRIQNTGGGTFNFEFFANGTSLGTYGLKGGNNYEIKVPETTIVAGWNTLAWKRLTGWANIDWHKFTLIPAPQPLIFVVH